MTRPPPPGGSRWRPSRRNSFARRDSNLALLGAVLSGAVIAFAILLLLMQRINPDQGSRLRGGMADALSPLISVARAPFVGLKTATTAIGDHIRVVETNRALRTELALARSQAATAQGLAADLQRTEKLIAMRRPERRVVASGIASAASATAAMRTAIVSAGFRDGVRPRMPVIAADGLAGRVTDVGQEASRIMLLTDANSRIPVKVLRTGWTGIAQGTGGTRLAFNYEIASGADRIRIGDRLVTSGDGGLFPPNLPVAVIIDASVSPPTARPLANPTGLGPVIVEAPWLPPPSFVPAPPAPSEPDKPLPAANASATGPAAPAPATAPRPVQPQPQPAPNPTP